MSESAPMVESLLLIGRPIGMDPIVCAAIQSARSTRAFPDIPSAVNDRTRADLVVVLQHWSDEYAPGEIRQLLEAFPLVRMIVCQGDWCVSDRRTRQYWPAALCVPVQEARARLFAELEVLAGRRAPLPWTAGLDEIFAFDHGDPGTGSSTRMSDR